MAARQPLNDDERRLLRIAARMPLASVANLAPVLGLEKERVRRMLGTLRRGGWVTSVVRGMTERRQHRWFLTRRAVDLLYVTDHQHPAPREEARASGLAALPPRAGTAGGLPDAHPLHHHRPANPKIHVHFCTSVAPSTGSTSNLWMAADGTVFNRQMSEVNSARMVDFNSADYTS